MCQISPENCISTPYIKSALERSSDEACSHDHEVGGDDHVTQAANSAFVIYTAAKAVVVNIGLAVKTVLPLCVFAPQMSSAGHKV